MVFCCFGYVFTLQFFVVVGCPYVALTQGHISDRLEKKTDRLLLLDYLTTELMAARILREKRPERKIELKIVSCTNQTEIVLNVFFCFSKRLQKQQI